MDIYSELMFEIYDYCVSKKMDPNDMVKKLNNLYQKDLNEEDISQEDEFNFYSYMKQIQEDSIQSEKNTMKKLKNLIDDFEKYVNSQNKVTAADLNSNHPFYIRIEDFSRKIYAPMINNQTYQTLWFFERARGQYDQPKMSKTKAERATYEKINPKSQKFTKTDLAKYLNASYMKPYDVSWGAEVNLTRFQV